jgi:hypothetical protein
MIIGLDQKIMQTLNHDGSNGEPYVKHLPGRSELYLVIPIREWDDLQAVGNHLPPAPNHVTERWTIAGTARRV